MYTKINFNIKNIHFAELIDVLTPVQPFQTLFNALWTLSGSDKSLH